MVEFLALIGATFIVIVLLWSVFMIGVAIRDFIKQKIYRYKIAHRFDKTPVAECYCKDCVSWDEKASWCNRFDSYIAECGFCWRAEPKQRT